MGLLLSILVVCVGVLEAVACFRHIQHGYLPFWMPRRRPTLPERRRRKPSEASSSSDDEISRLLTNDVMLSPSRVEPHYGLTPILAEHRRNTPILHPEEGDDDTENKYVTNDDLSLVETEVVEAFASRDPEVIQGFRPLSLTDSKQDGASVEASDEFGCRRLCPETERCESEVTLNGDEVETPVGFVPVEQLEAPVCVAALDLEQLEQLEQLEAIANLNKTRVAAVIVETRPATTEETCEGRKQLEQLEELEQSEGLAYLEATRADAYISETNSTEATSTERNETTNETDSVQISNEIPSQGPKPPKPVDGHPMDAPVSRPSTPSTPCTPRKVRADISWPVFHPDEPVIKRPSTELGKALRLSLSQDDSIDEDLLDAEMEGYAMETGSQESLDRIAASQPEKAVDSRGTCDGNGELTERASDSQSKPTLDMFLESLERLDKSLEAKDVDEDAVERVMADDEVRLERNEDLAMLLDCLDMEASVLDVKEDSDLTEHATKPFHSAFPLSTSIIPDLPTIPARSESPKVTFADPDIRIVDDHFAKTVLEDPVELCTSFVNVQAIPPSPHHTRHSQDVQTPPRGKPLVDNFGRIVGVETDEEVARRLEAFIEPKEVERAFDKKVASDVERFVSLQEIFEPECKKATAFCVAEGKSCVEDVALAEDVREGEVVQVNNLADSKAQEPILSPTYVGLAEDIEGSIDTTQQDPTGIEQETTTNLQSTPILSNEEVTKPLQVVAKEADAIFEPISIAKQQTNENASEFEPSAAIATIPSIVDESVSTQTAMKLPNQPSIAIDNMDDEGRVSTIVDETFATQSSSQPSIAIDNMDDEDLRDPTTSPAIGKDITSKESSIKRRKSYKKRSPRTSTESLSGEDHAQAKERRRELTASMEVTMVEEDGVGKVDEKGLKASAMMSGSGKARELLPKEEVLLEYGLDDDVFCLEVESTKLTEDGRNKEVEVGESKPSVEEPSAKNASKTLSLTLDADVCLRFPPLDGAGALAVSTPVEKVASGETELHEMSPPSSKPDENPASEETILRETVELNEPSPLTLEDDVSQQFSPSDGVASLDASQPNESPVPQETITRKTTQLTELPSKMTSDEDIAQQLSSSDGATALTFSNPNAPPVSEGTIARKTFKLTELSPSEEVQLAYLPPDRSDTPSPPPIQHRRESSGAISNNVILPVEVLHLEVGGVKEAAVFATSKEQGKRLQRPARAESFEEAVLEVRIAGRVAGEGGKGGEKLEDVMSGEVQRIRELEMKSGQGVGGGGKFGDGSVEEIKSDNDEGLKSSANFDGRIGEKVEDTKSEDAGVQRSVNEDEESLTRSGNVDEKSEEKSDNEKKVANSNQRRENDDEERSKRSKKVGENEAEDGQSFGVDVEDCVNQEVVKSAVVLSDENGHRKCTDPAALAEARDDTSPNGVDRKPAKEDDDDDDDEDESVTEVKSAGQASNPAFWLIFSGEYTKAMSKDWHSGHFCCWQCDESLTGQRYVLRDDHPYCIKCYESVFANMCEECSKTIGIDSKDLSYKDKHWHEACFLCNKCRVSLVDKQFGSKADKIYCGNCYDSQFASRCDGCGEIFRAGTKKMEYKTRQWHEKCFCCCVCKSAIGTKSFIPREQEIYCATCYEEKFATRCVKCNKIITSGGVTYKNEPWHRECFTCTHCSASLAGQRFTSRDEKPYCADCFGELFAKRCTACVKPITGIGGTRFISFEDRHWHNDCFICASCKASLVGRGFITDADDIICPECAKQKLM